MSASFSRFTLSMPSEDFDGLSALAVRLGMSRSALASNILSRWVPSLSHAVSLMGSEDIRLLPEMRGIVRAEDYELMCRALGRNRGASAEHMDAVMELLWRNVERLEDQRELSL